MLRVLQWFFKEERSKKHKQQRQNTAEHNSTAPEDITQGSRGPPQSGSLTWEKGTVAASSTLQRVLPTEVTHVRPRSHISLFWDDDTWGRVPLHLLINLPIPGLKGPGTVSW